MGLRNPQKEAFTRCVLINWACKKIERIKKYLFGRHTEEHQSTRSGYSHSAFGLHLNKIKILAHVGQIMGEDDIVINQKKRVSGYTVYLLVNTILRNTLLYRYYISNCWINKLLTGVLPFPLEKNIVHAL